MNELRDRLNEFKKWYKDLAGFVCYDVMLSKTKELLEFTDRTLIGLESQTRISGELRDEVYNLKKYNRNFNERLEEKTKEVDNLAHNLREFGERIYELIQERDAALKKVTPLQNENIDLKKTIEEQVEKIAVLENTVDNYLRTIAEKDQRIEFLNQKLNRMESQKINVEVELDKLKEENRSLHQGLLNNGKFINILKKKLGEVAENAAPCCPKCGLNHPAGTKMEVPPEIMVLFKMWTEKMVK